MQCLQIQLVCACFFLSIGYCMAKEHWFFLIYLFHIPTSHSYYLQLIVNAKKLVASRKMKAFIQPNIFVLPTLQSQTVASPL